MNSNWKAVVNRYSRDGRLQFTLAIFGAGVRRTRMPPSVGLTRDNFSQEGSRFYAKSRFVGLKHVKNG